MLLILLKRTGKLLFCQFSVMYAFYINFVVTIILMVQKFVMTAELSYFNI